MEANKGRWSELLRATCSWAAALVPILMILAVAVVEGQRRGDAVPPAAPARCPRCGGQLLPASMPVEVEDRSPRAGERVSSPPFPAAGPNLDCRAWAVRARLVGVDPAYAPEERTRKTEYGRREASPEFRVPVSELRIPGPGEAL